MYVCTGEGVIAEANGPQLHGNCAQLFSPHGTDLTGMGVWPARRGRGVTCTSH